MDDGWNWKPWYDVLNKPSWTPSGEIIAIVWWILYPVIIITYSYVFYRALFAERRIPKMAALPFLVNLIANLAFIVLFFAANNLLLATIDILIIFGTSMWGIFAIWNYSRKVAYIQIPYLSWIIIASILQISIFFLNS